MVDKHYIALIAGRWWGANNLILELLKLQRGDVWAVLEGE